MLNQIPPITTDGCDVLNLLGKMSCCQMPGSEVIYGREAQNLVELQTLHPLKGPGTQPGNILLLILFSHPAAVFN